MSGNEQKYIQQAFDSNWIAPVGENINEFERELEEFYQDEAENALSENSNLKVAALTSGTAAIHLALLQIGVKNGDTVLCQSNSHIASANPITYLGAKPIFIDSEKKTGNMDPELLEYAIRAEIKLGNKPAAIIVVHLYGMPAKMDEIQKLSLQYEIPIIEDAAEALGSRYKEKKCGSFGQFGVLSFNGNKIITTSGGGALVCHSQEEKDKTIFYATQAREEAPHYQHKEIGYNYRMSNVVAGIGRGQMEVLTDRIHARRFNYAFYHNALKDIEGIRFIDEPDGFYSNRWLTTIMTNSFEERERIRFALEKENIEARPMWKPLHLQPVFEGCKVYDNGVSENFFNRGLCLPSGSNLEDVDLKRIVSCIKSLY